eukprot:205042_1
MAHAQDGSNDATSRGDEEQVIPLRDLNPSIELSPLPPSNLKAHSTIQSTYTVKQFHDLLNGFVQNPKLSDIQNLGIELNTEDDQNKTILDCLDDVLDCIDKAWDDKTITTKTVEDVPRLLSQQRSLAHDALSSYYQDDTIIYDELLAMALKTKEMNFVIKKEKMIYIPENWQEAQVDSIKHKLTQTFTHTAGGASASHVAQVKFNVAEDPFAYVLHDKEIKKHDQLSRTATIIDTTTDRSIHNLLNDTKDLGVKMTKELGSKMVQAIGLHEEKYQKPMGTTVSKVGKGIVVCAGCRGRFNMKIGRYSDTAVCIRADIMDKDEWFCFHDEHCVVLRRLKESIRRYALNETLKKNQKEDLRTVQSHVTDLFENYDLLITVEKHHPLPKPFKGRDDDPERMAKELIEYNRTHVHQLRMRFDKSKVNRNKSADFPKSIKFANFLIYGESLATFVIHQLSAKQSDALWLVLSYIMGQIPTTTAIALLELHRLQLLKVQKVDNLEMVLSVVVQSSTYNVATALYLSAYIRKAGEQDLSRSLHWYELADKYIDISLQLANSVESDHLLSLLLEIPTDIGSQSVFQIAIKYHMIDFLDNARAQRLLAHLWSEFDFLNPHKNFRSGEIGYPELLHRLITKPNQFYYCPVGGYWIDSVMYLLYVAVVTTVAYKNEHDLTRWPHPLEWIMWVFTVGYLSAEITQLGFYGKDYMTSVGNILDVTILINWAIIGALRFHCVVRGHADECIGHDSINVLLHMFFFCVQVVILWSRIALLFRTSNTLGPFIAMLPGLFKDIAIWMFLLSIFFLGFGFGSNYIIAGDIPELHHFELVFEYTFITLLGQSDWTYLDHDETSTTGLGPSRSLLLKMIMWAFALVGTVLLVNLLIAMMASTYEHLREDKTKFVNFARSSQIYTSAYRYAVIPPPLNLIVFVVAALWGTFEMIVLFCSCRYRVVNMRRFDPISVDFHTDAQLTNDNANPPGIEKQERCCRLCLKVSPEQTKRICLTNDNYQRSAKYCRFCRCYMRDSVPGSLQYYFSLFRNYRLDSRDKKYLIALIGPNGVCPECFRPYLRRCNKNTSESIFATDRLYRRIVILEMISFWVFLVVMYVPLIIVISLPAVLGSLYEKINRARSATIHKHVKTIIVRDDKFTRTAESIVAEEDSEIEQLNKRLSELQKTMNDKFKTLQSKVGLANAQGKTGARMSAVGSFASPKRLNVIHQSTEFSVGDDDLQAALDILETLETEAAVQDGRDGDDGDYNNSELHKKMMESELEELIISKQLREIKRHDVELQHRKYDIEENMIKLRMQILLKRDDGKHDDLIGKLHGKLNAVKAKRKKLNDEMEKTERTFKFEDTQYDESVNEIKNKLGKMTNANLSGQLPRKTSVDDHKEEEAFLEEILSSGLLDHDDDM